MKFNCSYSVTFDGKKHVGRPLNAFKKACQEMQNFPAGAIEILVVAKTFLLVLYRDTETKFLEITTSDGVLIDRLEDSNIFDFVIPAKLVKAGLCQSVIKGFQHDMKIKVHLSLNAVGKNEEKKFERLINNVKQLQNNHENKSNKHETKIPPFCSCSVCRCQFCLQKKQKQQREQQAINLKKIKEAENVQNMSLQKALNETEQKFAEEKLTLEKQVEEERQKYKNLFDEFHREKEIFEKEQQKWVIEKEFLEKRLREKEEKHRKEKQQYEVEIRNLRVELIRNDHVQEHIEQQEDGYTVYVTETGSCFHTYPSCPGLSRAKAVYESNSKYVSNLRACKRC